MKIYKKYRIDKLWELLRVHSVSDKYLDLDWIVNKTPTENNEIRLCKNLVNVQQIYKTGTSSMQIIIRVSLNAIAVNLQPMWVSDTGLGISIQVSVLQNAHLAFVTTAESMILLKI